MKDDNIISIIVPVYNVEEYLDECLDSIKRQTYKNIEVILVNDGSTDGSREICEQYCEKDSRFKLINQENQGLSEARNVGVRASIGEYIFFVDSDDVVKVNILEILLSFMAEDIDIISCSYSHQKDDLQLQKSPNIVFQGDSYEAISSCVNYGRVNSLAWGKLYRRRIVEAVPFLKGLLYEDTYTGIVNLKFIRKMIVIDTIGYYYRIRSSSIMKKEFSKKNLDVFKICDSLYEEFKNDKMYAEISKLIFLIISQHVFYYRLRPKHEYHKIYQNYIQKYADIAKQSSEVLRSCRLLRWYLWCPKYFTRISFPLYVRYLSVANYVKSKKR